MDQAIIPAGHRMPQELLDQIWTDAHTLAEREHAISQDLLPWSPNEGPLPWDVLPHWRRLIVVSITINPRGHALRPWQTVPEPIPRESTAVSAGNLALARVDSTARRAICNIVPVVAVRIRVSDDLNEAFLTSVVDRESDSQDKPVEDHGSSESESESKHKDSDKGTFETDPVLREIQGVMHMMALPNRADPASDTFDTDPRLRFQTMRHVVGTGVRRLFLSAQPHPATVFLPPRVVRRASTSRAWHIPWGWATQAGFYLKWDFGSLPPMRAMRSPDAHVPLVRSAAASSLAPEAILPDDEALSFGKRGMGVFTELWRVFPDRRWQVADGCRGTTKERWETDVCLTKRGLNLLVAVANAAKSVFPLLESVSLMAEDNIVHSVWDEFSNRQTVAGADGSEDVSDEADDLEDVSG